MVVPCIIAIAPTWMSSVALGPRMCTPRTFLSGATSIFKTPLSAPMIRPRRLGAPGLRAHGADPRLLVHRAGRGRVAEAQGEAQPRKLGGEPIAHLLIEELEQAFAAVHHGDLHAERCEDAGVFAGDDSR